MAMLASGRKLLDPTRAKFRTLALTINERVKPPPPPSVRPPPPPSVRRPLPPPPSDRGLDRVTISSDFFTLTPDDTLCDPDAYVCPDEPSDILNAIDEVTTCTQWVIKCQNYSTGIFSKCLEVISTDSVFDNCTIDTKLKVLSAVFRQFRYSHEADPVEVFLMEIYLRSMTGDDSKNYKHRHEVSSKVLSVIQSYPKVGCHYKVTEETGFSEDLSFDDFDFDRVTKALYFEFKLFLSWRMVKCRLSSCKDIIDYIYLNRRNSMLFEEFREENANGDLFWPMTL